MTFFEGGGQSGMSGGPIFNQDGKLVGITYAKGSSIELSLDDYQDPHPTYYYPSVQPNVINIIGVDNPGLRINGK